MNYALDNNGNFACALVIGLCWRRRRLIDPCTIGDCGNRVGL